MLHILLLILKWIGIVLAVFLLLVLLLINLGLFVPVRYRADASCQNDIETLEAEFELSWMWKLFFLTACWKKGKADMKIRIGWKYLFSEEKEGKSEEKIEVPEEKEENEMLLDRMVLGELLKSLEKKQREIIVRRYFYNQTQTQIAEILGISQVQVSRMERKILREMREKL